MSDTVTAPHCPLCSRYMAGVYAMFKKDLFGEHLDTIFARCITHGLQEVHAKHCSWCSVFFDAEAWEYSHMLVKVREVAK